ncbi:hypothetical protein [Gorillibacterium sp. CAU 1737]|uniref:hypothetical protein n=1 Tax=Gorillibacterium sp. CAU 1737 TaxID=3140362 RepID=UPI003260B274
MSHPSTKVKLSQWDALLIESLKGFGWSPEEIETRVKSGDLPDDESKFHFDYRELGKLLEASPDDFRRALREGYQIKYNTIGGIRSWIEVTLDREALLELAEGKQAVEVRLTEEEKAKLDGVLSHGWHIASATPEDNGEEFYVIVKPNRS